MIRRHDEHLVLVSHDLRQLFSVFTQIMVCGFNMYATWHQKTN